MTFSNAIKYLRNGYCAKTPDMRGYVKRIDYTASDSMFSTLTPYAAGDVVGYAATQDDDPELYVFTSAHSAGAWDGSQVTKVSSAYQFVFKENDAFSPDDTASDEFAFTLYVPVLVGTTATEQCIANPAMNLDARLWQLMLRDDWDTFLTSEVAQAAGNTSRW